MRLPESDGVQPANKIAGFFGPYRWLSNFHGVRIFWNGEEYRSSEHAYQAAKHIDPHFRAEIARYTHPRDAMKAGRSRPARPDWDGIKVGVMFDIISIKFRDPVLRRTLLETGDAYLEETNAWGDTFWGVCNGKGFNFLGHTLMLVREQIVESTLPSVNSEHPTPPP